LASGESGDKVEKYERCRVDAGEVLSVAGNDSGEAGEDVEEHCRDSSDCTPGDVAGGIAAYAAYPSWVAGGVWANGAYCGGW
jgi:hypothetical protein